MCDPVVTSFAGILLQEPSHLLRERRGSASLFEGLLQINDGEAIGDGIGEPTYLVEGIRGDTKE